MSSTWEDFYASTPKPSDFEDNEKLIHKFTELHAKENTKIVLVTVSGINLYFLLFWLIKI